MGEPVQTTARKLAAVVIDGVRTGLVRSTGRFRDDKILLDRIGELDWNRVHADILYPPKVYEKLAEAHSSKRKATPNLEEVVALGMALRSHLHAESPIAISLDALTRFATAFALQPSESTVVSLITTLENDGESVVLKRAAKGSTDAPRNCPEYKSAAHAIAMILEAVSVGGVTKEVIELYLRSVEPYSGFSSSLREDYIREIVTRSQLDSSRQLVLKSEERADFVRLALKLNMIPEAMCLVEPLPEL